MRVIKPVVYLDSKKIPTIGVGFNLRKSGAREAIRAIGANYERLLDGDAALSDSQIFKLLIDDAVNAYSQAKGIYPSFDKMGTARQLVVVDMVFNMGAGKYQEFEKHIDAMRKGDWKKAGDELVDSKWYLQVGERARRDEEMVRTNIIDSTIASKSYKTYAKTEPQLVEALINANSHQIPLIPVVASSGAGTSVGTGGLNSPPDSPTEGSALPGAGSIPVSGPGSTTDSSSESPDAIIDMTITPGGTPTGTISVPRPVPSPSTAPTPSTSTEAGGGGTEDDLNSGIRNFLTSRSFLLFSVGFVVIMIALLMYVL